MDFATLLEQRRTVRRFSQKPLATADFKTVLESARRASCAANRQQLRYIVCRTKELTERIFPHTRYAARVKPHRDPVPGVSAPTAFIAITAPRRGEGAAELLHADAGAAIQSMEFAAWERGIGCCWLGAFDRAEVEQLLNITPERTILYLLALGFMAEQPVLDDAASPSEAAYYLDTADVLHVPKLTLEQLAEYR